MLRFIFFTYFQSVWVVFCVTYYYRLSYYTYIYKILYVRSSVIRPRSRLTIRKIKTRIVGCKTPRRCQEITAICRQFVVVHTHTSYYTTIIMTHYPPPTANAKSLCPDSKKRNRQEQYTLQTYIIVYGHTGIIQTLHSIYKQRMYVYAFYRTWPPFIFIIFFIIIIYLFYQKYKV